MLNTHQCTRGLWGRLVEVQTAVLVGVALGASATMIIANGGFYTNSSSSSGTANIGAGASITFPVIITWHFPNSNLRIDDPFRRGPEKKRPPNAKPA